MIRDDFRREQCLSCRHSVHEILTSFDAGKLIQTPVMMQCKAPPSTSEEIMRGEVAGICMSWEPTATKI